MGLPGKYAFRIAPYVFLSDWEIKREPLFQELALLRDQVQKELLLPPGDAVVQVYLFESKERYELFMNKEYPDLPPRRAFFVAQARTMGGAEDLLVYTYWGKRIRQDRGVFEHELTAWIGHVRELLAERFARVIGIDVHKGLIQREQVCSTTHLPDPPSAVFAASDTQAMGVLAAADRAARQVPDELSVIGFDDIESAKLLGLSTVRQPLEDSGTEAARRLCALLRGEPIGPLRQQLPLEVVHRSSTAHLRGSRTPAGNARAGNAARVPEVTTAGRT